MPIIVSTNTNFDERKDGIRNLVMMGLDSLDGLTDDAITNDVYLGDANRYFARKVPNYDSLNENDRADLEVAVSKRCAANILKSTARRVYGDADRIAERAIYLDILTTIETYLQDSEELVAPFETTPAESSAYFEVINLE